MPKAKARLALFAVLLVCAIGAAAPLPANADFIRYYSCSGKPSNQWCDGRANGTYAGLHSWDWNEGYVVPPLTTVCVHVWKPSTGNELSPGTTCGFNSWVGVYYGNVQCACYEAEAKHMTSGTLMSVFGKANAG